MSLARESIAPLLRQLRQWEPFARTGLNVLPLDAAAFADEGGFAVWTWPRGDTSLRGKGTSHYWDEDGMGLILTLAGADSLLLELEIWRHDGQTARKAPTVEDLTVMERDVLYGPRPGSPAEET